MSQSQGNEPVQVLTFPRTTYDKQHANQKNTLSSPGYYGTMMTFKKSIPQVSQHSLHPLTSDPVEPPVTIDPVSGSSQPPQPVSAASRFFRSKQDGRNTFLRGVNLSGAAKQPFTPNLPSHCPNGFFDDSPISFVGRPFPLSEADEHFSRLRLWGFNFLRFNFTWEAVEHAGPGIYDDNFCDYVISILYKAKEYGFRVFMDPHQDVWSRFTGGSGAPCWTLSYAGLNPRKFAAANAALVHNIYPEPSQFPKMIWATNYFKLATSTMFTLFFGGKTFAPKCFVSDVSRQNEKVHIQDFLQGHYMRSVQYLAQKIHDAGGLEDCVVLGYDTLNEPSPGWIGCHDITTLWKEQELRKGLTPTALEAMILGSGQSLEQVQVWEVGATGPQKIGTAPVDPKGESVWIQPSPFFRDTDMGCIWANHGVWDPKTKKALIPHYFSVNPQTQQPIEFLNDFWKPFIQAYTTAIRTIHKDAIIFVETPVLALAPRMRVEDGDPEGPFVYAPHWYDGMTLISKHWNNWFNVDYLSYLRGKYSAIPFAMKFGETGIKQAFKNQLKLLRLEGEAAFGACPTLIGEIGIPYDMDDKAAYLTGDYSSQIKAMDANMTALEQNLLNFTIWNYCPDNSNVWGDQWNGEDLSIWSPPQRHSLIATVDLVPKKDVEEVDTSNLTLASNRSSGSCPKPAPGEHGSPTLSNKVYPDVHESRSPGTSKSLNPEIFYHRGKNLNDGARALDAFVRPFPILIPGTPLSIQFDLKKNMFSFTFEHPITESMSSDDGSPSSFWDLDSCGVSDPHVEFFLPLIHFPKARNTLIWVSDGHVGLYLDVQRLVWRCGCHTRQRHPEYPGLHLSDDAEVEAKAHEVETVPCLADITGEEDVRVVLDSQDGKHMAESIKEKSPSPRLHTRQKSLPEVKTGNGPIAVMPIISERIQSAGSVARHTIVVRYVHPTGREPSSGAKKSPTLNHIPAQSMTQPVEHSNDEQDERSRFRTGSRFDQGWIQPIDSRQVRASDDDDTDSLAMCPQCLIM